MNYPFKQKRVGSYLIREFKKNVESEELVWHRDEANRVVEVIKGRGWKFQRENFLPVEICEGDSFKIPAGQFHRLIKGNSDLVVKIFESKVNEDDVDEGSFTYKIAQAALDGKDTVEIGGKEHPVKMSKKKAKEIVDESDELSESDTPHPRGYGAPQGSQRDKKLDATKADLASGDPERVARAFRRRKRMEDEERNKKGFKNKPRKDTKKESVEDSILKAFIREILVEEIIEEKKKKRKKAKKKRKSSGGGLSAATKETLKKKAQKRGLTPSSVYAEFRKGLAAWASSGSRKGMSQHQWAHARVNSANPSKSWAVVKKAKKRKKRK